MENSKFSDWALPTDRFAGTLLARVWLPPALSDGIGGPSPVLITEQGVLDLSRLAPTTSELINQGINASDVEQSSCPSVGQYKDIMANTMAASTDPHVPYFLSPFDLQAIKACGVTFMCSLLERVIEEQAGGDASRAQNVRVRISNSLGADLSTIIPGSDEAEKLKDILLSEGLWSQYLEVGIGPYAEVFTKAQPMSSVGTGAQIGILSISNWNNPEPEIVLAVDQSGRVKGACLGNDVNLRDIEGRSALLLGKAKDNNASTALGPFIRLFDDTFSLDDVRQAGVSVKVEGVDDGFLLEDKSDMKKISRDVLDLVSQTMGRHHQYPDGMALFTGTLFAPSKDRRSKGMGFTHELGDTVTIASDKLGVLQNRVAYCEQLTPWTFGTSALMHNLSQRNLL